jgi:hypothetical protein
MSTHINDRSGLLAEMIDFNTKYATYIRCNDPSNKTYCSTTDVSLNTVVSAYQNLALFSNNNPKIPNIAYDASLNYNINTYNNNVLGLRSELDEKMKVLNLSESSILSEEKTRYDVTIYTGVLWTILATSIVYYVFTRL